MIDLHTHTTITDGTLTPKELIQKAKEIGLSAVAITDHDSIEGLDEAQSEADRLGIRLVKGIEFSVAYGENRLIHVLGLGIDPQNERFREMYIRFKQERSERLSHIFRKLQTQGVVIERKSVEKYVANGFMDRQAIAKYLVAEGYVSSMLDAWINYLDPINYIDGELLTPKEVFSAIHAAGGKAFLAHYHLVIGLKGYSDIEAHARLEELKGWGLDGMEYYYPSFSQEDTLRCAEFVEHFGFLKSGGTDFHGENREHIELGVGEGDFSVPDEVLEKMF